MHYIERVEVEGFWGDRRVTANLHKDINFFIGENGTGKTNLINMIAAALSADFPMLDRLPFRKIIITLHEQKGRKKPKITVSKEVRESSPYPAIIYQVKFSAKQPAITFNLDDIEEERYIRHYPPEYYRRNLRRYQSTVTDRISSLVKVTWLSIHRTASPRTAPDEKSFESSVDKKLSEISEKLIRYFSSLEKQSNEEMRKFQESIFLSLLYEPTESVLRTSVRNVDLKSEESGLTEIFRKFRIPETQFAPKITRHFERLKSAQNEKVSFSQLLSMTNRWRIQSVVQEWNKLIDRQKDIFKYRDNFLDTINGMMSGKELRINEKNEIFAFTGSEKVLLPQELSSGEKQLLILLSEALLQQSTPWIYIADEPELSLHVRWQAQLMKNVIALNPNCQIICATHSPDVVGPFRRKILKMQDLISKEDLEV